MANALLDTAKVREKRLDSSADLLLDVRALAAEVGVHCAAAAMRDGSVDVGLAAAR